MITDTQSFTVSLAYLRQPSQMVYAARYVLKNPSQVYMVSRTEAAPVDTVLMNYSGYKSLVTNLSPSDSLAVKLKEYVLPMTAAAPRIDEVWRVVQGASEFLGSEVNSPTLNNSGFQHKIDIEGQTLDNQVDELTSAGGGVQSVYPIESQAGVTAWKPGPTALTVEPIPNLQLGAVPLHDGGSAIANGVAVELDYQTYDYTIMDVQDDYTNQTVACFMTLTLYNYLVANQ